MERKVWTTPTLVTLARGEPQEAILTACKSETVRGGPNEILQSCETFRTQSECTNCFNAPAS